MKINWQALIGVFIVFLALYLGKVLFVPLFFAAFISFLAYPVCKWLEAKKLSKQLAIVFSTMICFIPMLAVLVILVLQIIEIGHYVPLIIKKISLLFGDIQLTEKISITAQQKEEWIKNSLSKVPSLLFAGAVFSVVSLIQVVIIPFYVVLILFYREKLVRFIHLIIPAAEKLKLRQILKEIVVQYYNFFKGMLIVYVIVALLNGLGFYIIGLPDPLILGVIASLLTFIPYVGIIIGATIPVMIAWTTYDNVYYPLAVIGVLTLVQILEAYLIFPLAVSNRIKVNPLAILISIFLGAIIWGTAGMILFIPFAFILKLLADRIDSLKPWKTLLED